MKINAVMSYNLGNSSKLLSEELHIRRISREASRFIPSPNKTILNWGCSYYLAPDLEECKIINKPSIVEICVNKLLFFRFLKERADRYDLFLKGDDLLKNIIPSTESKEVVNQWLQDGKSVCARQKLEGQGGDGIMIFDATNRFPHASLFTLYIKKKTEFRIHVAFGKVIAMQQKKRRDNVPIENPLPSYMGRLGMIRNMSTGYIYARNEIEVPDSVIKVSLDIINLLGLDFGAVDVIWNEKHQKPYILEVNTAPGLEGQTVLDYANAMREA